MDFWDDLIGFIKGGKVVPIVGQDLLTIEVDGRQVALYSHLAGLLAKELKVDVGDLGDAFTINQVVCRYLQNGGLPAKTYLRLNSILANTPVSIPEPLRQLARIKPFHLFVSTTFDGLMERALNAERFSGAERTVSCSYAPNLELDRADLPRDYKNLRQPLVFHLFGKSSEEADFVVTEEDTLEFVSALQMDERRPNRLFDELKGNHLLLIGNNFPDWLARFFLRLTKGERLSAGVSNKMQYFADDSSRQDKNLVLFLKSFGRAHLEIFTESGPVDFVRQLSERWAALPAARPGPNAGSGREPVAVDSDPVETGAMERNAIFISYAREDEPAAHRIAESLEEAGLSVWLDRSQIQSGEAWKEKIRRNVSRCALFLAVVSRNTHQRREGGFLFEWFLAEDRKQWLQPGEIFIIPVPVDDSEVPERFADKHYDRYPDGNLTSDFVRGLSKAVDKIKNRERAA